MAYPIGRANYYDKSESMFAWFNSICLITLHCAGGSPSSSCYTLRVPYTHNTSSTTTVCMYISWQCFRCLANRCIRRRRWRWRHALMPLGAFDVLTCRNARPACQHTDAHTHETIITMMMAAALWRQPPTAATDTASTHSSGRICTRLMFIDPLLPGRQRI